MAHLIKLEDYISRYQFDLNRYPSQYTRMKKERWYYLKSEWEQLQYDTLGINEKKINEFMVEESKSFFKRLRKWTKGNRQESEEPLDVGENRLVKMTLEQVREEFLKELFQSQLRWASSSLLEESILDPQYKRDKWLKFFAQQIPDNYFLLYKPVFFIKKAPIELDIILISPTEIYCITILDGQEHSVFEASSDRFWTEFIDETRKKKISPLVSLSRMSGVLKPILQEADLVYPLRKIVLSPTSIIDNKMQGTNVEFIDKRTFSTWTDKLKKHPSPIKNQQLKITSLLLNYCHTYTRESEDEESSE
ncbi:NERD domain-containing protein [Halalkalibacter alkalisediminis]|uniref:NERD domain-containing protein n=1 Tax=Halalkalibacter alkalisediminis TaxID=935616 RepID=A0ABV6NP41_9BACI|nr:NERD domain-containing protein [Halalkalibacter alkalisediminis]